MCSKFRHEASIIQSVIFCCILWYATDRCQQNRMICVNGYFIPNIDIICSCFHRSLSYRPSLSTQEVVMRREWRSLRMRMMSSRLSWPSSELSLSLSSKNFKTLWTPSLVWSSKSLPIENYWRVRRTGTSPSDHYHQDNDPVSSSFKTNFCFKFMIYSGLIWMISIYKVYFFVFSDTN